MSKATGGDDNGYVALFRRGGFYSGAFRASEGRDFSICGINGTYRVVLMYSEKGWKRDIVILGNNVIK